jgi:hypothetical protein
LSYLMADNHDIVPPIPRGWPKPPSEAAYWGLAGEIVRTIEPHTESDPAAVLLQTLVGFGNVVGPGPHFKVEAARHGLNLFLALVGQSSRARKGSAWGYAGHLLGAVDSDWAGDRLQHGLSSGEGLIRAVWDGTTSEPGVNDKRLLVFDSEFGGTLAVMARHGNTLSSTLRQAWDGGGLQVMTRRSPLKATEAHVSIIAHTTQEDLHRYLGRADTFNGFANRFLWPCVRRSKYLAQGGNVPPRELRELTLRLRCAAKFARQMGEVKFSENALAMWTSKYPELTADLPGLLGAVTSRAEAQVRRLAAIYALLESSETIKTPHLKAALAVWGFCFASAKFIFGGKSAGNLEDKLLSMLKGSPGGLTRTSISDSLQRHATSASIDRALSALSEKGHVEMITEASRGRPVQRWLCADKED